MSATDTRRSVAGPEPTVAELLDILRSIEWSGETEPGKPDRCPCCGEEREDQDVAELDGYHGNDCDLANAIGAPVLTDEVIARRDAILWGDLHEARS